MKKRIISIALILAMLVSSVAALINAADDTPNYPFTDVPDWAVSVVNTVYEKGIMNGTTIGNNTFFMPDKSVSRVDFVVMLMHAIGVDEVEAVADTGFDDDAEIPKSMKGYVYKARDMGLINGAVDADGNYLFEPNRAISRAEAALIVNKVVKGSVPTVKPTFADKNEIPAWAQDAIYSLNDIGILVSINGEFAPSADLTRAQTAQTLYALMEYLD